MVRRHITPFSVVNTALLVIIGVITLYPMIYIISLSISSESAVMARQVTFLPRGFQLDAYARLFRSKPFFSGYLNPVIYAFGGTAIAMAMTILTAYPLSKKRLPGRSFISLAIVFTMFFQGGLIPMYMVVRALGLINTRWAILLPVAINPFFMIIMRTFFQTTPESLEESAEMDGLNPLQTLWYIVLPVSKAVLAAIGLFYAVWFWNDWFRALIFLNDQGLQPVTLFLRNVIAGAEIAQREGQVDAASISTPPATFRSAAIVLVTLPIVMVYPFVQKYFVTGILIGSLKE